MTPVGQVLLPDPDPAERLADAEAHLRTLDGLVSEMGDR